METVTIFLLSFIVCFLLFAYRNRDVNYLKLPPGPPPLPIIGNLLQVKTNNLDKALSEIGEKYGPVFTLHLGGKRIVVLSGYKAVKEALVERAHEFAPRGDMPLFDQVRNGLGVIFSNGERWKQLRRFALTTLRDFGMGKKTNEERIQEEAQCLLQKLRETEGKPFDPTSLLNMALANVICAISFGKRYGYEDKRFLQLTTYINELFVTWSSPWGQLYNFFPSFMTFVRGPHKTFKPINEILNEFILEEVEHHRETLDANIPRDFMDSFLIKMDKEKKNNAAEFSIENLVHTVSDVVFAGTETSSTTMRYGILILLKYPEVEEKVHEEIDQVIGKIRRPCLADRINMPYTDAVIHEIQRFTSLVPTYPHAVFKDTPFRQYVIPKGTIVYPLLTSVLQSSEEFPNPKDFDPHHFLHKDGTFKTSDHFIPFSAGKRICAGEGLAKAELFLFLTTILQNFALKSVIPHDKIDLTPKSSSVVSIPRVYKVCLLPR